MTDKYYTRAQLLKAQTSVPGWDDGDAAPIPASLWDDAADIAWLLCPVYGDIHMAPGADGSIHLNWIGDCGQLMSLELSSSLGDDNP